MHRSLRTSFYASTLQQIFFPLAFDAGRSRDRPAAAISRVSDRTALYNRSRRNIGEKAILSRRRSGGAERRIREGEGRGTGTKGRWDRDGLETGLDGVGIRLESTRNE